MEDLYSIHPGIARATTASAGELSAMRAEEVVTAAATGITDLRKARIASHPLYPSLLSAYIDCRKVGAPPETVTVLENIARERHGGAAAAIGADPELDEFMDSYYRILVRYKDELSKPFNDAVSFLATIESQLHNLCKASSVASSSSFAAAGGGDATADAVTSPSDEALGSSDEEPTYWDVDASESHDSLTQVFENYELKEMLLKKYSVHLTSLRTEFLKKRKKGKLPKDARLTLLDWWNYHYQWPYPTPCCHDARTLLCLLQPDSGMALEPPVHVSHNLCSRFAERTILCSSTASRDCLDNEAVCLCDSPKG